MTSEDVCSSCRDADLSVLISQDVRVCRRISYYVLVMYSIWESGPRCPSVRPPSGTRLAEAVSLLQEAHTHNVPFVSPLALVFLMCEQVL